MQQADVAAVPSCTGWHGARPAVRPDLPLEACSPSLQTPFIGDGMLNGAQPGGVHACLRCQPPSPLARLLPWPCPPCPPCPPACPPCQYSRCAQLDCKRAVSLSASLQPPFSEPSWHLPCRRALWHGGWQATPASSRPGAPCRPAACAACPPVTPAIHAWARPLMLLAGSPASVPVG